MGKQQYKDDFMTPQELLVDIMAEMELYRVQLDNLVDLTLGANAIGFERYEDLEPKRKRFFKNKARKKINRLLLPMISFMVAPTVVKEVIPEPVKEPITEKLVPEEDLSPERIDANLLPQLHEDEVFYGQKTSVLG